MNNAYLLSYKRYSGHQQLLENELNEQFNGDILKMLEFYQKELQFFIVHVSLSLIKY